jgi:hypothetical protein
MFHAAKDFYARGHRNDGDDLAERAFQCGHPEAALLLAERRAIEGKASEALRFLTLAICRIPDDCIDSKRYPLFMARAVLKELIESLQSTQGVKPC